MTACAESAGRSSSAARLAAWLRPSLLDLVFIACLLRAVVAGSEMLSGDGDPARHLTVGEQILASGRVPREDLFSDTMAGQPFVAYEWLAELATAASARLLGLAGPVLLHGTVLAAAFALLFWQLRSRGTTPLLAFGTTLVAAATSMLHWSARPHVFTILGAALFSALLDGWRDGRVGRGRLWLLPLATLLWANLHGGFLVGFLLIGAYGAADLLGWLQGGDDARAARARLAELAPVAVGCLVATLGTPAGLELWPHVTGYFGKGLLVDGTQEYQSPNFHASATRAFLAMLIATIGVLALGRRRPRPHELFLLLGFTYCALYAQRNIPLFAVAVAPLLAASLVSLPPLEARVLAVAAPLGRWLARRERRLADGEARARDWMWSAIAVIALAVAALSQQAVGQPPLGARFDPASQPVGAAAYLREHPVAGNGFNYVAWGGFLLHERWPAQRVFIDGQTDFYGEALAREYLNVETLGAGWRAVLDRRAVEWILFPTDAALVREALASGAWQVRYQDETATLLVRAARPSA